MYAQKTQYFYQFQNHNFDTLNCYFLYIDCQHKAELERDSDRSYRTRNIKAKNIIQLFFTYSFKRPFFYFFKKNKI